MQPSTVEFARLAHNAVLRVRLDEITAQMVWATDSFLEGSGEQALFAQQQRRALRAEREALLAQWWHADMAAPPAVLPT